MSVYPGTEEREYGGIPELNYPTQNASLPIAPRTSVSARIVSREQMSGPASMKGNFDVFETYNHPSELTMYNDKLLFRALTEREIHDKFPFSTYRNMYLESDTYPFTVFNGLRKTAKESDLFKMYKFLGVVENGPIYYESGMSTARVTDLQAGKINFLNITKKAIQPGTPMTWSVGCNDFIDSLRPYIFGKGHQGFYPPSAKRKEIAPIVEGYFLPMTMELREHRLREIKATLESGAAPGENIADRRADSEVLKRVPIGGDVETVLRDFIIYRNYLDMIVGYASKFVPPESYGVMTLVPQV